MIAVKVTQRPPSAASIIKQINYGTARGLTEIAKDGQKAVLGSLKGTFTLRGGWFNPSNAMGIKIKIAKPTDMASEIRTRADWLDIHEKGGTKKGRSGRLAIPTANVRRNKRDIIARANRPAALRNKRTFVIKTSKGDVLFQRKYKGKRSQIVALYNLEQAARIRRQSTFEEPIEKVVKRRGLVHIEREIRKALATMR
jgi:hypothetical protein